MKTKLSIFVIGFIIAAALLIPAVSAGNGIDDNGAHYNLNIIATKTKTMDNSGGNVIFCPLGRSEETLNCRIYLVEGPNMVVDKNGTDGTAIYQLPKPYSDTDTDYSDPAYRVYVRVLGKPGGVGKMVAGLCLDNTDPKIICDGNTDGTDIWFSSEEVALASHSPNNKESPNQKFVDVTHALTTINLDNYAVCGVNKDQRCGHIGLFEDNPLDWNTNDEFSYFWDLYNKDMKIIQLRFYPVATAA